jgi:hypothetical protein
MAEKKPVYVLLNLTARFEVQTGADNYLQDVLECVEGALETLRGQGEVTLASINIPPMTLDLK